MRPPIAFLCLLLLAVGVSASQEEGRELKSKKSIAAIASGSRKLRTLVKAVGLADLVELLSSPGTYTVFAPTNAAFNRLGKKTLAKLTSAPYKTHLKEILSYHILGQEVRATDILKAGVLRPKTLQGQRLRAKLNKRRQVRIIDNSKATKSAKVRAADVVATNGIVHIVNNVLLPSFASKTIVDLGVEFGLNTLLRLLTENDLASIFADKSATYTVFAPTDEAFASMDLSSFDKKTIVDILKYHVVPNDVVLKADLSVGSTAPTLLKENISVTSKLQLNGNRKVVTADVLAINGVVHVIDKVLLPPSLSTSKDIVKLAQETPQLSTLVDAVIKGGLVETLQGDGPFTVFAPTNSAFKNLLASLGAHSLDDVDTDTIVDILTYHVVLAKAFFKDLEDGSDLNTVQGSTISVRLGKGGAQLNGETKVVGADNTASNGVVHIIDKVLLPPSMSGGKPKMDIVAVAQNNPHLSILVDAVIKGGLVETLQGDGPYTVFAPTNSAFRRLLLSLGVRSLDDVDTDTLVNILKYHVVPAKAFFKDLEDGSDLNTVQGSTISVRLRHGSARLNKRSRVLVADNEASNGVVHIINNVLFPR